ncbi:MAG: hypothetical protein V1815_00670, partial [Candidatus Woesearchaeota archaeon]
IFAHSFSYKNLMMKFVKKIVLIIFIFSAFSLTTCSKRNFLSKKEKGIVHFTGDTGLGACGYMIELEFVSSWVRPVNLDDKYKKEDTKIRILYTTLTQYSGSSNSCGMEIYITSIKDGW